jgi:FPC/CPF motif-containing protein YcgG
MPNFCTSAAFVDTATKCFAIAASSPSADRAQARAECAFVIVSRVVNVFDEMTKSVSSGREVARRLDEVRRVDVRDEPERQVAARVVAERLVGHDRGRGRSRRYRR